MKRKGCYCAQCLVGFKHECASDWMQLFRASLVMRTGQMIYLLERKNPPRKKICEEKENKMAPIVISLILTPPDIEN